MPVYSTEEFLARFPNQKTINLAFDGSSSNPEIIIASRMPGAEARRMGLSIFDPDYATHKREMLRAMYSMGAESTYGVSNTPTYTTTVQYQGGRQNGKTIMMNSLVIDSISDLQRNLINGIPEEKVVNQMITREAAEALAAQAAQALALVNEREAKWGVDDFANGTILYADIKWYPRETLNDERQYKTQRTYNYAFIKAGDRWYSSGPRAGGQAFTWDELINWLNQRYVIRFGAVEKIAPTVRRNKIVSAG